MALDIAWPGVPGDAGDGFAENWWVDAFKDEMWQLAQQKGSKLRGTVRNRIITGDATFFERLAPSDPVEKITRHTVTPQVDVVHSRRKVSMTDWLWSDMVDHEDKRRMLVDPVGAYTTNAGYSMGRKWDDLIIAGLGGPAEDGTGTPVAFLTAQTVPAGGVGFTLQKFLDAKRIMDDNDVDMESRVLLISPQEEEALLGLTEITSLDYNVRPTLVEGRVRRFLGCDIIVSTRLVDDDTDRSLYMYQKNAAGLAINQDTEIRKDERPDVSYALQVFARFTANATRIDDAGVVKIESAIA
jgi:hypothetical protein